MLKNVACAATCVLLLSGCAADRLLTLNTVPTAPQECAEVMDFQIPKYPDRKTTTTQVFVWSAQDNIQRQKEHQTSRVCAEYGLRVGGITKEKSPQEPMAGAVNGADVQVQKDGTIVKKPAKAPKAMEPSSDPFAGS